MVFGWIADSWYNRRHYSIFTKELEELAARWKRGKLLNVGCGHGADFLPFRSFELFGLDSSGEMLSNAKRYMEKFRFSAHLKKGDVTDLPYKAGVFDFAITIAVYHHIKPGKHHRAFSELFRVLKAGGEAFIAVWNKEQERFSGSGKEAMVPWKTREKTHERYYYLFSRNELEEKLLVAGFEIIEGLPKASTRDPSANISLLVKKV